eukprot:831918-Prymnesium_polylepis.2
MPQRGQRGATSDALPRSFSLSFVRAHRARHIVERLSALLAASERRAELLAERTQKLRQRARAADGRLDRGVRGDLRRVLALRQLAHRELQQHARRVQLEQLAQQLAPPLLAEHRAQPERLALALHQVVEARR